MDSIKEAFQKVKQDIDFLTLNLQEMGNEIISLKGEITKITSILENNISSKDIPNSTSLSQIPTDPIKIHQSNTYSNTFKAEKAQFSTGNDGVPTDRQTDRQTDRHMENVSIQDIKPSMEKALEVLNSLDSLKKEIRLKFKSLTEQEMAVFSEIYRLDDEVGFSDYKVISRNLNLTESSIRDYVGKLIKKGISVEKRKVNNKQIHLNISQNLKKIASLQTIISLRGV